MAGVNSSNSSPPEKHKKIKDMEGTQTVIEQAAAQVDTGVEKSLQNSKRDRIIVILALSTIGLLIVSSITLNVSNQIMLKNIQKSLTKDKK